MTALCDSPDEELQPINFTTNFQLINLPSAEKNMKKYRDNVAVLFERDYDEL